MSNKQTYTERSKKVQKNSLRVYVQNRQALKDLIHSQDYKSLSVFINEAIEEKIRKLKLTECYNSLIEENIRKEMSKLED